MRNLKISLLTMGLFAIIITIGCQRKQAKLNAELRNIELLRGELILCSGSQFGEVKFALSCKNSVKKDFDMAIALLHSFEYEEAEKAFVKVMEADPECAMAYWGVAMSIYHSIWAPPKPHELDKAVKVLAIAKTLQKSDKHQKYLEAIGAFYEDWKNVDHKTRAKRYEKKMEALYKEYKDDTEAAIFYSLALNSTADPADKTYKNQKKAGKILESIFPDQPNHPGIAHYIIHNYDNPDLAPLALETARRYAQIAPASSHAQHMPSHIFTRLGLWEESIESNLNSASSAVCYSEESGMKGHWINEVHAIDYLVYAYLQKGDNANATEQYETLKNMFYVNPHNLFAIAYPFSAIPARMALENRRWKDAAELKIHDSEIEWEQFPWQKSILHFGRALGATHIGDVYLAEAEIEILKSLEQVLIDKKDAYKANQVAIEIKSSQAWLKFAKGENDDALSLMKEAAKMEDDTEKHPVTPGEVLPARELLGDMLMALNQPLEALKAYELNIEERPGRFNGLYGAAIAAKAVGDNERANIYFERLLVLGKSVNSDRPELVEAKEFVSNLEI
jgi:tetratricopeptide (TPR) repeat protein